MKKRIITTAIITVALILMIGAGLYGEYYLANLFHMTYNGLTWAECVLKGWNMLFFRIAYILTAVSIPVFAWFLSKDAVELWETR